MSGVSLPKEEEHHHLHPPPPHDQPSKPPQTQNPPSQKPPFLTFRQLNSLAIMLIFSASGMVSLGNIITFFFSILYTLFLSNSIFPNILCPPSSSQPPILNLPKSRLNGFYILFTAIIGLLLPILYIFEGVLEGDKQGIKAAVPQVFIASSQVFLEGFVFSDRYSFSWPVRVFLAVYYNACRIYTLVEWVSEEMVRVVGEGGGGSMRRLYVGRVLAVANFVLWCYNLFGNLLPVFLPWSFKAYYAGNGSVSVGTSKRD